MRANCIGSKASFPNSRASLFHSPAWLCAVEGRDGPARRRAGRRTVGRGHGLAAAHRSALGPVRQGAGIERLRRRRRHLRRNARGCPGAGKHSRSAGGARRLWRDRTARRTDPGRLGLLGRQALWLRASACRQRRGRNSLPSRARPALKCARASPLAHRVTIRGAELMIWRRIMPCYSESVRKSSGTPVSPNACSRRCWRPFANTSDILTVWDGRTPAGERAELLSQWRGWDCRSGVGACLLARATRANERMYYETDAFTPRRQGMTPLPISGAPKQGQRSFRLQEELGFCARAADSMAHGQRPGAPPRQYSDPTDVSYSRKIALWREASAARAKPSGAAESRVGHGVMGGSCFPCPPRPRSRPTAGDRIRAHHLLKCLARLARSHVGCFA